MSQLMPLNDVNKEISHNMGDKMQGPGWMSSDSPVAQLYKQYASNIFIYAYQKTSSYHDAEDIVVNVFLAALEDEKFLKLGSKEQLAWLWRVAHNKLVDTHRYTKRHSYLRLEPLGNVLYTDEEFAPEQVILREEEYVEVRSVLRHLPPLQQRVMHLRFVDGLRSAEIARVLGKSEVAVRALLSRTLNQLRDLYKDQDRGKA